MRAVAGLLRRPGARHIQASGSTGTGRGGLRSSRRVEIGGAGAMKQHGIKRRLAACSITVKNLASIKLQPAATEKLSFTGCARRAVQARGMKSPALRLSPRGGLPVRSGLVLTVK